MVLLYFAILFASTTLGTGIVKYSSVSLPTKNVAGSSIYCIFTSLTAMLFFALGNRFVISFNTPTAVYAFIYALICLTALVSGLFMYAYMSVAIATVAKNAFGLVITSALGIAFFDEPIGAAKILKICLMLVSIFLVFGDSNPKGSRKGFDKRAVLPLAITIASSVGATLITRVFSRDERITDNNSLFFLTNLFMLLAALAAFLTAFVKNKGVVLSIFKCFGVKGSVVVSLNTVCSNIGTLCQTMILRSVDVSIFSPVSAALGIISGAAVSLAFRERLEVKTIIAVIVSALAMLL